MVQLIALETCSKSPSRSLDMYYYDIMYHIQTCVLGEHECKSAICLPANTKKPIWWWVDRCEHDTRAPHALVQFSVNRKQSIHFQNTATNSQMVEEVRFGCCLLIEYKPLGGLKIQILLHASWLIWCGFDECFIRIWGEHQMTSEVLLPLKWNIKNTIRILQKFNQTNASKTDFIHRNIWCKRSQSIDWNSITNERFYANRIESICSGW